MLRLLAAGLLAVGCLGGSSGCDSDDCGPTWEERHCSLFDYMEQACRREGCLYGDAGDCRPDDSPGSPIGKNSVVYSTVYAETQVEGQMCAVHYADRGIVIDESGNPEYEWEVAWDGRTEVCERSWLRNSDQLSLVMPPMDLPGGFRVGDTVYALVFLPAHEESWWPVESDGVSVALGEEGWIQSPAAAGIDRDFIVRFPQGSYPLLASQVSPSRPDTEPGFDGPPEEFVRDRVCPYLGECEAGEGIIATLQDEILALRQVVEESTMDGADEHFERLEGLVGELQTEQEQAETRIAALEAMQFRMFENIQTLLEGGAAVTQPPQTTQAPAPTTPGGHQTDLSSCIQHGTKNRCFNSGCYWFRRHSECRPWIYPAQDPCFDRVHLTPDLPLSAAQGLCINSYDDEDYQCVWDDYIVTSGAVRPECHVHTCEANMSKMDCRNYSFRVDADGMQHRVCEWNLESEICYTL